MLKKIFSAARVGAVAVAVFAAGAASQDRVAQVPVKVNVDATVSIQPPSNSVGAGETHKLAAGEEKVFHLSLGNVSVSHILLRRSGAAAVSYGRGGVSLKLHARQYGDAAVSLHTVSGRRVMHGRASASKGAFSVSRPNLARGVYMLSAKGADGASFSTRVTHGGGKFSINVAFGGEAAAPTTVAKQTAPSEFGEWTITATAAGHVTASIKFRPTEGMNELKTVTMTEIAEPTCTNRSPDQGIDVNSPHLGLDGDVVVVKFDGNTATVDESKAEGALTDVKIEGAHVRLTSTYTNEEFPIKIVVSGSTENGSLKTNIGVRTWLYMNGASIKNPNGSAMAFWGKRTYVNLVGGCDRQNYLESAGTYVPDPGSKTQEKGVIFGQNTLDFTGGGYLKVKSAYNHGIVSDGNILINNVDIVIPESVADGIHANDDIEISGGNVYVNSVGDAIQSEMATTGVIGITVSGGKVTVITSGVRSHGIASEVDVFISGSANVGVTVSGAASKGIRARRAVGITGGEINVRTSGGLDITRPGDPGYDPADTTGSAAGIRALSFEMSGGKFTTVNTGENSKGINISAAAVVKGGEIEIRARGDGMKVDGNLSIQSGSKVYTESSAKKGVDCAGQYSAAPNTTTVKDNTGATW